MMLISCDCDGVLLDMINPLLEWHNERYGTKIKFEDVTSHDLWRIWGGSKEEDVRKLLEFFKTRYVQEIKPVKGAVEAIKFIKKYHESMVISSRPNEIEEETNDSIERYFPEIFSSICVTNQFSINGRSVKKSEICLQHRSTLIIEDSLENAVECRDNGIDVILLDYPWNQSAEIESIHRLKNWQEILDYLFWQTKKQ